MTEERKKIDSRHFFVGRFYNTPKSKEDPSFIKADDFTAQELGQIDVTGIGFKWEHHTDIDIGRLVSLVQANDGSTFVLGYVDTSEPIGRLMADAMKSNVLNGLSMAHNVKVKKIITLFF